MMKYRVIVNGAHGKMGQETVKTLHAAVDFECVAGLGRQDDLAQAIAIHEADIVVDFTEPSVVYENATTILDARCHAVIGTTGLTTPEILKLQAQCEREQLGSIIAPNFSLGAILLMKMAAKLMPFFPRAEIIETHHDKKKEAPSGTAIKTAELMAKNQGASNLAAAPCVELIQGARGAQVQDIPIHSLRLSGHVAQQTVIFGGQSETLTLKHDTLDRSCFMPGVLLACREVVNLNGLVYGLEDLITV